LRRRAAAYKFPLHQPVAECGFKVRNVVQSGRAEDHVEAVVIVELGEISDLVPNVRAGRRALARSISDALRSMPTTSSKCSASSMQCRPPPHPASSYSSPY
jgi:hypothetical protein